MTDAFEQIGRMMTDAEEVWRTHPAYYLFEPWSVPERPKWVRDIATADGVDLNDEDIFRCAGKAPRPFQDGYHLSTKFGRVLLAGSQVGKSLSVLMDVLMRATQEIPFCYRYPKGHDTGIPRPLTRENIIRWGRRSKDTGEIIDRDPTAYSDGSWDCGNVMGAGVFPRERIVPPGTMIRVVSTKQIINQNWWPAFTGGAGSQLRFFVPPQFIDRSKGSTSAKGSNKQEHVVYLTRNVKIQMLTYESEVKALEGIKVPTYLDEEPKQESLWGSLISHATDWSLSETPYYGITWTKPIIFPKVVTDDQELFHACAYDCPYKTREELARERAQYYGRMYEIGPRLWGMPTGQSGEPYYDRDKINFWIKRWLPHHPFKTVRFEPTREWGGIKTNRDIYQHPGLLDTPVRMVETTEEDEQAVWRLYEDRQDGVGYVSASDQAEGADTPEEAGDRSTCVIGRQHQDRLTKPVCCATLRSTLPVAQFTREVLYAARYFNNALLAPETGRGGANRGFEDEADGWPWWFIDSMIRQSTRKAKDYRGFCPTTDRRDAVFDRILRNWMDEYKAEEYPCCPDEWILKEAAAAVVSMTRGGEKKCDHPTSGNVHTIDSLMAWGILMFVLESHGHKPLPCRGGKDKKGGSIFDLLNAATKKKKVKHLGGGTLVFR